MLDPITIISSLLASSVVQTAAEGVLGNQSDRTFCDITGAIADKLKTQTPAENHELSKAFRRACVMAMQHICDARKVTVSGQSNLSPQHGISKSLLGNTPIGLFASDENEWLEKADKYLLAQIEDLNQDRVYTPEQPSEKYQSLLVPKTDATTSQERITEFSGSLTGDLISELRQSVGEIPRGIETELNSRLFSQIGNEFQKALSHNQILANIFQNRNLVELNFGQQEIKFTLEEILNLQRELLQMPPKDLKKVIGVYVQRNPFVDREDEQKDLNEWLSENGRKFVVIKAASGYGKTSLVTEVLHEFAPEYNLPSDTTGAIFIFYCRDNQGSFAEVCSKADQRLGKTNKADAYTLRYAGFLQQTQQSPDALPLEIVADLLEDLSALRHVWFIFDNFESVLDKNHIKDAHLNLFFEKALATSGLHFLLTSQKVPQFETLVDIEEVHIGDLPDSFTLEFLQSEGAKLKKDDIDCGLAEITSEDLQTLKELGFTFVPMALVALVGYFKSYHRRYKTTLTNVLQDHALFEQFREHDAKKGSMHLIELQYVALSGDERLVLKTLSVFGTAIEFPALAQVLAEHLDEDAIDAVLSSNTLARRIGANSYELLPQAAQIISNQPDQEDEKLNRQQLHLLAVDYYYSIRQPIAQCYTREQFAPYFDAADHSIKAQNYDAVVRVINEAMERLLALGYMREIIARCQLIAGKLSQPELEANNFINLGLALYSQGRLPEAIAEYDKTIRIYERLVNEERRDDLANDLAMAYLNKGNVLYSQGRLPEAIAEYDKTIEIRERLVSEEQRDELANDLAGAYLNKGVALYSQGKLPEAIAEYDKTIEIRERLVNDEQRDDLANALAKAYLNKGVALSSQGKLPEAIAEYDKTIEIRERLVNDEQRDDLANALATNYMNKGIALYSQGKLPEAIAEYDKTIEIRERLVNEERRDELANDLAMAYLNKGLVLENVPDLFNALFFFDMGIEWREKCLARGDSHVLPDYVKDLAHRVRMLIKLEDYQRTASDILTAFQFINLLEEPDFPEYFKQRIISEMGKILFQIKNLSVEKREEIYEYLGANGDVIRQFVDNLKDN